MPLLWTFQIEMKRTGLSSVSQNEHVGFCSSPACVAPFYSEVPSPKLTPLFLAGSRAVDNHLKLLDGFISPSSVFRYLLWTQTFLTTSEREVGGCRSTNDIS